MTRHSSLQLISVSKMVIFISIFLFSMPSAQKVSAEPFTRITADHQLAYADDCFQKQDYACAVAEYKRFIYFFPDDPRTDAANYQIGMSYFQDQAYTPALKQFTGILDQHGPQGIGISSAFMISRCYQKLNNYPAAIKNLFYLRQLAADQELDDTINMFLGWLYLESGDFDSAKMAFGKIRPENKKEFQSEDILADLDQSPSIPQKSPAVAGILSIIPGGGYLYCGRYRDALAALIINGALIFGACESFEEDLYAIGGIISVIEAGFYAGSIYGGITSAHKFNQAQKNAFVRELEKKYHPDSMPEISLIPSSKGITLGLTYRF